MYKHTDIYIYIYIYICLYIYSVHICTYKKYFYVDRRVLCAHVSLRGIAEPFPRGFPDGCEHYQ